MYRIYIEDKVIVFTAEASETGDAERLRVEPDDETTLTKLLQKVQFTKRLEVISARPQQTFEAFRRTLPAIEAGGGLVADSRGRVLMIFRNGRWDLPKGKREPGEAIRDCALREVQEECSIRDLTLGDPITETYHAYCLKGRWVLKRTSWFWMHSSGEQAPVPQTVEGITEARWIPESELSALLPGTYPTIRDVFAASGRYESLLRGL